jgi:hypothetical protein
MSTSVGGVSVASAGASGTAPTTLAKDERRAKSMEEHRRLVKEHRDREGKLRERNREHYDFCY